MSTKFVINDKVDAPSPDSTGTTVMRGTVVGVDGRKVAVDFERNSSDVWVYDVTELDMINVDSDKVKSND